MAEKAKKDEQEQIEDLPEKKSTEEKVKGGMVIKSSPTAPIPPGTTGGRTR